MEPLNGFQANAAPSEAAGLPAACLAKRLACVGVGRAAKRCARRRGSRCKALRWHGCWLRRQVPCRRRLHNPQRPQGGRTTQCMELPRLAQAAKRHVDAVYLIRGAGSTRARRTLRLPGRGLRRQVPCRRRLHNPQRRQGGRQLLALLTFSCAGVGHAAKRGVAKAPRPAAQTRMGQARVDIVCKAPCAWRVPPPSRGRSPLLPVCKSYQQCKKGPARLLVLGVYPPPAGAGPRYYPYVKVISSARSDLQKVLLRGVYPPPPAGQVPAITRMQKLSTVH